MCPACQIGATLECFRINGKRCSTQKLEVVKGTIVSDPSLDKVKQKPSHKADEDVRDAHSTGRKRAAILLPLTQENGTPFICEWAGLKFAGGGKVPIIGCTGNQATHRHHGPDKNTLNNERDNPRNIHRICTYCHNRWHASNDIGYAEYVKEIGGPEKLPAHDMETKATAEEMVANELRYQKASR
jgi:hypothetical protein